MDTEYPPSNDGAVWWKHAADIIGERASAPIKLYHYGYSGVLHLDKGCIDHQRDKAEGRQVNRLLDTHTINTTPWRLDSDIDEGELCKVCSPVESAFCETLRPLSFALHQNVGGMSNDGQNLPYLVSAADYYLEALCKVEKIARSLQKLNPYQEELLSYLQMRGQAHMQSYREDVAKKAIEEYAGNIVEYWEEVVKSSDWEDVQETWRKEHVRKYLSRRKPRSDMLDLAWEEHLQAFRESFHAAATETLYRIKRRDSFRYPQVAGRVGVPSHFRESVFLMYSSTDGDYLEGTLPLNVRKALHMKEERLFTK